MRAGAEGAADALCERFLYPIASDAVRTMRDLDSDQEDDLKQLAAIKMWSALPRLDLAGNPYAFLRRTATRVMLGELQRIGLRRSREMNYGDDPPEIAVD